jgi:hypothetical protein
LSVELSNGLVDSFDLGDDGPGVGGFGGEFFVGTAGGFFAPMPRFPPAARGLGVVFRLAVLLPGADGMAGGVAFASAG